MIDEAGADLVLEYDLDATPEKVFRAINIAEIRRRWLPDDELAEPTPIEAIPDREVRYRIREKLPPFLESVVRFEIAPDGNGGTRLRIVHQVIRPLGRSRPRADNGNVTALHSAA